MSDKNKHIQDRGWSAMSATLDKEMPVEKKEQRRPFFWIWLFGAALLGSILFVASITSDKSESPAAVNQIAQSQAASRHHNTTTQSASAKRVDKQTIAPQNEQSKAAPVVENVSTAVQLEAVGRAEDAVPASTTFAKAQNAFQISKTSIKAQGTRTSSTTNISTHTADHDAMKPVSDLTHRTFVDQHIPESQTPTSNPKSNPTSNPKSIIGVESSSSGAQVPLIAIARLIDSDQSLLVSNINQKSLTPPNPISIRPSVEKSWTTYALAKGTAQPKFIYGGGIGMGLSKKMGNWSIYAEGSLLHKKHEGPANAIVLATVTPIIEISNGPDPDDEILILLDDLDTPEATIDLQNPLSIDIVQSTLYDLEIGLGRQISTRWTTRVGFGYQRLLNIKNTEIQLVSSDPLYSNRLDDFAVGGDFLNRTISPRSSLTWNAELLYDLSDRFALSAGYQGLLYRKNNEGTLADDRMGSIINSEIFYDKNGSTSGKAGQNGTASNRFDLTLMYKF